MEAGQTRKQAYSLFAGLTPEKPFLITMGTAVLQCANQ